MSSSKNFLQSKLSVLNPEHVMKDAEVVLEYAKEKFIQQSDLVGGKSQIKVKVVVHGESMGGMVASYVAMRSNIKKELPVDFAFIDRTFASLDNVAFWQSGIISLRNKISQQSGNSERSLRACCLPREKFSKIIGKLISRIFRLVTLWKDNSWLNFSGIEKTNSKYCLIGCDPVNDGIIYDLSSLKNANARQLINDKLNVDHK